MSSGTYTETLNYATNFNVPLLIHAVVCSSGLNNEIMNIYLGNVTFDSIFEETGYKLTEEDRVIWNKYHSNKADLSEKESCFHIFSMPLEIHFKGDEAKEALLKMFTPDKCLKAKGYFNVIRK